MEHQPARPVRRASGATTIPGNQIADDDGEAARAEAVEKYRSAASSPDRVFARMAGLAASIMGTPMAAVSLVDRDRNWFLGTTGFDGGRDVARDDGLCGPVIAGEIPAVAMDVQTDPMAAANRFVRAHGLRSYVCVPLVDARGHVLGTVAVMDTKACTPDVEGLGLLEELARVVTEQLEARLASSVEMRDERRRREAAESGLLDARRDLDGAERARDMARRDRDEARSDRREAEEGRSGARLDRDSALEDRDVAERERDEVEQYASVLQRTLVPPTLPQIDGLSVAAHYYPASSRHVGGDFYDLFGLGDDRWAFFIGDVEGHGAEAAAATSLIRYTLRSAALHHRDLGQALAELNEVLLRELRPRRLCTVLLGIIERVDGAGGARISIATGGHLPALLLDPETRSARPIRPSGGMLVGAFAAAAFESCSFTLRSGQTLLLYTDGLIEARRGDPAFDEGALAAYSADRAHLDAVDLTHELATLIPKLKPSDDVALLVISAC